MTRGRPSRTSGAWLAGAGMPAPPFRAPLIGPALADVEAGKVRPYCFRFLWICRAGLRLVLYEEPCCSSQKVPPRFPPPEKRD